MDKRVIYQMALMYDVMGQMKPPDFEKQDF